MTKSQTIVDPNVIVPEFATKDVQELACIFLETGFADSMKQALYLATVRYMNLGWREHHVAMAVGRMAGPDLNPVDTTSPEFARLCWRLAQETLLSMPAEGRA